MNKKLKIIIVSLSIAAIAALLIWYLQDKTVAIFESRGVIANEQRKLIIFTLLLSLIIVLPVFALLFGIVWRYREGRNARYDPKWDHNRLAETIWWLVPLAIIVVLGVVTYRSTHQLDPYKTIASNVPPVTVQVVALDWKWLFIYPNERIATVNHLELPVDTPVNFKITSAGPMNSFWIPQLGGQVYAMSGMTSQLHLMANATGEYRGSSANLSGEGFAGMHFTTNVTTQDQYYSWTQSAKNNSLDLDSAEYKQLVEPTKDVKPMTYGWAEQNLYDRIVMSSMQTTSSSHGHGVTE